MATKYQMKNGLSVLLIESKKSPVVSVQVWVKTGSADEKAGVEGISHFIEHLVFKGTDRYGVGEIAKSVENSGGILNAYTTFDQTVFYVTMSKEHVDTGLSVLSEMMGRPTFDSKEVDSEREVVIEEIKRSLDNPRAEASRLLFETFYKKHPYGIPVIGYDENIRRVSVAEIRKYFSSRYVPKNMKLVVVGDFDSKGIKRQIDDSFGRLTRQAVKPVVRRREGGRKAPRVSVRGSEYHETQMYLAWPAPKAGSRDYLALTVLSAILGEGETSRLVHKLRNELHLVNAVGTSIFSPKEEGFFATTLLMKKENVEAALKIVQSEIFELIQAGVTEDEVGRAIRMIEAEKFYSMETVDGLAGLYGYYEFFYGDYKKFESMVKALSKVATKDVVRVARKYLGPKNLVVTALVGGKEENTSRAVQDFVSVYKAEFKKLKSKNKTGKRPKTALGAIKWRPAEKTLQMPLKRIELASGGRAIFKKMIGSPVVSLRAALLGGLRYEPEQLSGLSELTARVWSSGTKTLAEKDFNLKLETMVSSVSAFGGRNSIGLSMSSLVPFAKDTFSLFSEVMLDPRIEDQVIDRERKLMIESIRSRKDKPAVRCMQALNRAVFKGHPYGRDPLGTEASLEKIGRDDILKYLKEVKSSKTMVLSMAGDFETPEWQSQFERLSKGLRSNAPHAQNWQSEAIVKNQVVFDPSKNEQSHLALAYRGLTLSDPHRHVLDVMQTILSGQGGRLFIELRDKASLAYSVSPIRLDGLEPGYFGAYIGCSPEKAQTAFQMMRNELIRLGEEKITDKELNEAKQNLIGRHDISLQRTAAVADGYLFDELYGLDIRDVERYKEIILGIDAQDVQNLARRLFAQNFILAVVGRESVSI